jgi:recombinational DNA repair protein (RecF pathway)
MSNTPRHSAQYSKKQLFRAAVRASNAASLQHQATIYATSLLTEAIKRLATLEDKQPAVIYGELQEVLERASTEGPAESSNPQIPAPGGEEGRPVHTGDITTPA